MRDGHTYFFTSYFLSTLLHTGPSGRNAPRYEYNAVRRWGKTLRRANGILGVKEIFVPINCRCEHWLFLRANTTDKTVVLWDSQGVKQSNQLYLDTMVKYLGDKYNELTDHPAVAWTRLWRKIDDSGSRSPASPSSPSRSPSLQDRTPKGATLARHTQTHRFTVVASQS